MDLDDFRSILDTAGVDVWTFIDTAILVASLDYAVELKQRRDMIVERLYATCISTRCRNCDFGGDKANNGFDFKVVEKERGSPSTPASINGDDDGDDDDVDPYGGLFDDEQKRILDIKEHLEVPDQSEESLVDLLQSLADMDITFKALKETDIGRHVNRLRKHSSNDVRRLVKHLVRKWKDIVDEWVKLNPPAGHETSALMDGSSGSDKNNSEPERKSKSVIPAKRETPTKPTQSAAPHVPQSVQRLREQQREREQKESNSDSERLALARKRLQANYKEAENAKRQRTIQVMDIHDIPKPKNTFFGKNKGNSSQGRHW
ncbi:hypothetical protein EZV62_015081 [Acer yangbiense]|uniref:TFIIS N-terminal domain-containing protein n=1 Tax=Acer yangbiense TaxID=1000413 RepID=A0A5C7HUJ4_9ROSI|nr:hypothetical protein EZV62_015081 [Acer yangbiense]